MRASHTHRYVMPAILAAVLTLFTAAITGCSAPVRNSAASHVSAEPSQPWTPPESALAPAESPRRPTEIPEEFFESKDAWTLDDIVDMALRNNPATRATWAAARASAARVGSKRGAYFPQIDGSVLYVRGKSAFSQNLNVERKYVAPGLSLHFILFDFGKRSGDVQEARQALYAANWSHNAMIQNVVLEVEHTYYQYLYSKALRDAAQAALEEAKTNLDAAKDRQSAGLATVADVLQAESNYAQRKLALETVQGQIQIIRGSLATAMGLSPTLDYDVGLLPSNLPVEEVSQTAEDLLKEAEAHRPDLAAARAQAEAARAHAKSVKAEAWPVFGVEGDISRWFYDSWDNRADNYNIGVSVRMPLFTGLTHSYDVVEAEANADAARERYETTRSSVELDVWSSYYDLKTASERLVTAQEFLDSATESHTVATERYQSGVGTILELLSAQTTLEEARAQDVQSRTDWFLAVAQLAHATGRLGMSTPIPTVKTNTQPQEDQ